eukprot:2707436-Prymnesium_polylepis.1
MEEPTLQQREVTRSRTSGKVMTLDDLMSVPNKSATVSRSANETAAKGRVPFKAQSRLEGGRLWSVMSKAVADKTAVRGAMATPRVHPKEEGQEGTRARIHVRDGASVAERSTAGVPTISSTKRRMSTMMEKVLNGPSLRPASGKPTCTGGRMTRSPSEVLTSTADLTSDLDTDMVEAQQELEMITGAKATLATEASKLVLEAVRDRWIIPQMSHRKQAWDLLIAVLAAVAVVITPMQVGFPDAGLEDGPFKTFSIIVDILFLVDVGLGFVTSFTDDSHNEVMVFSRTFHHCVHRTVKP